MNKNIIVLIASNQARYDFNAQVDSFNARCGNHTTDYAATGPQP